MRGVHITDPAGAELVSVWPEIQNGAQGEGEGLDAAHLSEEDADVTRVICSSAAVDSAENDGSFDLCVYLPLRQHTTKRFTTLNSSVVVATVACL